MIFDEVNYCLKCGSGLTNAERYGRLRKVCPNCEWIYFNDPKVAAGALVEVDNQVLLVRRAIDPERGLWTLPAGFVDAGEDPALAAKRECFEETGLHINVTGLVDVMFGQEHARGAHIIIFYRGEVISGDLRAGDDVDQVAYFSYDQLPKLAFRTTNLLLQPHARSVD